MPVTINTANIVAKSKAALNAGAKATQIRAQFEDNARDAAKILQGKLQDTFDEHKVTSELKGDNKNTSEILSYGNIKAYFGLSEGKVDSDLTILRELFSHFNTSVTRINGTANYRIEIRFPKIEEYYAVTPPPEEAYGTSWLRALEMGLLQNFGNFLFRERGFPNANSRSGTGVQVKPFIHRGLLNTVPAIKYISDIYNNVLKRDNIQGILKSIRLPR